MDNHEISERVRQQYERYPYPDISPDTDRPQMLVSGHLELMCQVVWGGRKKAVAEAGRAVPVTTVAGSAAMR